MPSWSPDGSRLAFFANDGKGTHLWIWSASGGASRVTQRPFGLYPWAEIRWAKHGSAVITSMFEVSIVEKTPAPVDTGHDVDSDKPTVQVRISPRHSTDRQSTSGPNLIDQRLVEIDVQTGNTTELSSVSSGVAAVAPDASRLVHARHRSDIQRRDGAQNQNYWDLWLVSVNGDKAVRIAEAAPLAFPLSARVSLSPDGRFIAYRTLGLPTERKLVIPRFGSQSKDQSLNTKDCPFADTANNEAPLWEDDSGAVIFQDGDSIRECAAQDGRTRTLATVKGFL